MYTLGSVKYEIPEKVIKTFNDWNSEPLKQHKVYDKLMVEALVLIFIAPEDIANGSVSAVVSDFICAFLETRTNNDAERMSKLEDYIEEACKRMQKNRTNVQHFFLPFHYAPFFKN